MGKEIQGIIDWRDVRYWTFKIESFSKEVEIDCCIIRKNKNGSFNIKNNEQKINEDLYPNGIKAIIYK